MSNFGKKRYQERYQESSSADEERNEKRVQKKQNTGRKGRYSSNNKSAWPDLLQNMESQMLNNNISYLNRPLEQISDLKKIQQDNEVRLSILLDLVDKTIFDESHDYKKRI
eukprot:gene37406-48920_t